MVSAQSRPVVKTGAQMVDSHFYEKAGSFGVLERVAAKWN